jgi:diguanylate cyclase (GGDEF)-like protein
MSWGAVISLIDQDLYGNLAAFLINLLAGSFMFYVNPKRIIIPLLLSGLVLFIGLPVFQPSRDILVGHYTNATIFIILSWLVARTNYQAFTENFMNRKTIKEKTSELLRINNDLLREIVSREQVQKELEAANQQLAAISSLDALTGIPNRRKLDEVLQEQWNKAVKSHIPIAIIMIDIDLFKLYNDSYGHLKGDYCLQEVARVIDECRRGNIDLVARYGGEEFIFVAVDINKDDTLLLAEKIRAGIESLCLEHSSSPIGAFLTSSLGISWQIPYNIESLTECIDRADRAMYQAKKEGRNRVIMAEQNYV